MHTSAHIHMRSMWAGWSSRLFFLYPQTCSFSQLLGGQANIGGRGQGPKLRRTEQGTESLTLHCVALIICIISSKNQFTFLSTQVPGIKLTTFSHTLSFNPSNSPVRQAWAPFYRRGNWHPEPMSLGISLLMGNTGAMTSSEPDGNDVPKGWSWRGSLQLSKGPCSGRQVFHWSAVSVLWNPCIIKNSLYKNQVGNWSLLQACWSLNRNREIQLYELSNLEPYRQVGGLEAVALKLNCG